MQKNTVFEHPCGEVSAEITRMWGSLRSIMQSDEKNVTH
jgi:hypothetical protein